MLAPDEQFGKGAIKSPPDERDFHLSFLAGSPPPVDWSREFRLPEPPDSDQRNSDCCTAEATSYFHWQLTGQPFAVRSVFAYIALSYGSYLRDGPKWVHNHGQQTFEQVPDPKPKTMSNMRSKAGLDAQKASEYKVMRFFDFSASPDEVAQAVRDWKGAIFGLMVGSTGWEDKTHPKPPKPNAGGEGHALYAFGYHMHDGQKCIIAKSSWCRNGHHEHHIRADYFASGYTFNQAFVMVPEENLPMIRRFIVQDGGKLGILLVNDGTFESVIHWAKSEAMFQRLLTDYEVPADAPRMVIP
jgi:hypothetical protein